MSYQLHHGDCLVILPTLEDCSVDAIVTDPPAGIAFMGKAWDRDKGGKTEWIDWMFEVALQCRRVIKPGGHALVWAIPRTSHWTGSAWEDAGWQVRDKIYHVFGCLSDDTEILINGQWEPYRKAVAGSLALCYNPETDEYQWQAIQEYVEYEYDDTAFRIRSDHTDQIVSRNHRCLVERGGGYAFAFAETLEREASVPVLESLQDLLKALPVPHERASGAEPGLQVLHKEQNGQVEQRQVQARRQGLPALRENVSSETQSQNCEVLQQVMQGEICNGSDPHGKQVRQNRNEVSGDWAKRRIESGLEGRRDLFSEARQLQAHQVCSLPGGVSCDGKEGWICDGASVDCCQSDRAATDAGGGCSSCESRPARQQAGEPGIVCQQSGPQTVRASRFTRSDLASVEPVHYRGKVWCIRVPFGAFVARRNGKVFVTGNSGFPKSMDVSKAIDKAEGAERELGPKRVSADGTVSHDRAGARHEGYERPWRSDPDAVDRNTRVSYPATPEAKQWAGWGTALKPAAEEWWLFRKPLEGTVAANVLKHGTGAINIDASRIGTDLIKGSRGEGGKHGRYGSIGAMDYEHIGRWPANFTHDGSDEVMALLGDAARFFYSPKASKSDRDEGVAGVGALRDNGRESLPRMNFHPTVKSVDLMAYLCRLITPPGGTILDPFTGSGSTGKAAIIEDFKFIGIEREAEYIEIARARLQAAVKFRSGFLF